MIYAALYGAGVATYGAVPPYKPAPQLNGIPLADPAAQQDAYPFSISGGHLAAEEPRLDRAPGRH